MNFLKLKKLFLCFIIFFGSFFSKTQNTLEKEEKEKTANGGQQSWNPAQKKIIKAFENHIPSGSFRFESCGERCLTLLSNTVLDFKIVISTSVKDYEIVVSRASKVLKIKNLNFLDSPEFKSALLQWMTGHEQHPYLNTPFPNIEDPVLEKTMKTLVERGRAGTGVPFERIHVIGEPHLLALEPELNPEVFLQNKNTGFKVLSVNFHSALEKTLFHVFENHNKGVIVAGSLQEAKRLTRFFRINREHWRHFDLYPPYKSALEKKRLIEKSKSSRFHYLIAVRSFTGLGGFQRNVGVYLFES